MTSPSIWRDRSRDQCDHHKQASATLIVVLLAACSVTSRGPTTPNTEGASIVPVPSKSPPSSFPSPSGQAKGRIAFSISTSNIYTVNADGSGLRQLTHDPADEFDPSWSPDGKRIAFRHEENGNAEIWAMNADGSAQENLTHDPAADWSPAWSPDGRRIAFASDRGGSADIWVMNADGSDPVQVTTDPAIDEYPSWSPDGMWLAFNSDRTGREEIWIALVDGSEQRQLTQTGGSLPAWSPVGTWIAFQSPSPNNDVFLIDTRGSSLFRVTRGGGYFPVWSPDGSRLLYGTGAGLATVLPDGSRSRAVPIDLSGEKALPDWA